ncbi:MAG: hypothetical protein PHR39_06355 [Actinomycetota bacterium]|nr:hypothetical protein [Actinomycetota bacterium]
MNENSMPCGYVYFTAGIAPVKIKSNKEAAYPLDITIPSGFIIDKVVLRVLNPVLGKKVSVGTKDNNSYLAKDVDVSSKGIVIPGIVRDKHGNIIGMTLGQGLCNVVYDDTNQKKIIECYPKGCIDIAKERLYVKIPENCGIDQAHGGLNLQVFVYGYTL